MILQRLAGYAQGPQVNLNGDDLSRHPAVKAVLAAKGVALKANDKLARASCAFVDVFLVEDSASSAMTLSYQEKNARRSSGFFAFERLERKRFSELSVCYFRKHAIWRGDSTARQSNSFLVSVRQDSLGGWVTWTPVLSVLKHSNTKLSHVQTNL